MRHRATQRLGGDVLELQRADGIGHAGVDGMAAHRHFTHAVAQRSIDGRHLAEHAGGFGTRFAGAVQVARGHVGHRIADLGDGLLRAVRQLADLLVEGGGTLGQVAHLVGDHREAAAGLAGAGRFDGGVQRQQVGLVGDRLHVLQQREDAVQVLGHVVDVVHGGAALAGHLLQRLHQLFHALAGVLGETRHVHAGAVAVAVAVDDAGDGGALFARLAVHRVEAAAQAADGLADQFAGAVDLVARALDLVVDEAAQIGEQCILFAHDAGMLRRDLVRVDDRQPGEDQPGQGQRCQQGPLQGVGPVETDRQREQQGQDEGCRQTNQDARVHGCSLMKLTVEYRPCGTAL